MASPQPTILGRLQTLTQKRKKNRAIVVDFLSRVGRATPICHRSDFSAPPLLIVSLLGLPFLAPRSGVGRSKEEAAANGRCLITILAARGAWREKDVINLDTTHSPVAAAVCSDGTCDTYKEISLTFGRKHGFPLSLSLSLSLSLPKVGQVFEKSCPHLPYATQKCLIWSRA